MKEPAPKSSRLAYIDNIRVICIVLVIVQHTAVTYSGLGSWYYVEASKKMDMPSSLFFWLLQSHLQAFFMSMFFLISGYFIPAALARKGARAFALDRLLRLGIPLLVYVFLLHPLTVRLLHPELNLGSYYWFGLTKLNALGWTGPLWFVEALLIFSLACLPFSKSLAKKSPAQTSVIRARTLWIAIAIITAGAFAIRLVLPIGTAVANLQFCFFSAYVVSFVAGVLAGARRELESISYASTRRWLLAAFGIGLPLWFTAMVVGGAFAGRNDILGGMNAGAFLYALWESFFCVAFIVALVGIAREKLNFQRPWMHFAADNTFGVYVFHTVVLVAISLSLRSLTLPAVAKFCLVALIAVLVSFGFSGVLRQIPVLRRWFS